MPAQAELANFLITAYCPNINEMPDLSDAARRPM